MKKLLFFAFLVIGFSSCTSVKVEQNRLSDIHSFRRYSWTKAQVIANQNPLYKSDITYQNIKAEVDKQMAQKGYVLDEQNPEFLITYREFIEPQTRMVSNNYAYPFYGMYGGFRGFYPMYAWGGGGYYPQRYINGTFVIDCIAASDKRLLWRGSMDSPVNNPAKLSSELPKQAKKILARL